MVPGLLGPQWPNRRAAAMNTHCGRVCVHMSVSPDRPCLRSGTCHVTPPCAHVWAGVATTLSFWHLQCCLCPGLSACQLSLPVAAPIGRWRICQEGMQPLSEGPACGALLGLWECCWWTYSLLRMSGVLVTAAWGSHGCCCWLPPGPVAGSALQGWRDMQVSVGIQVFSSVAAHRGGAPGNGCSGPPSGTLRLGPSGTWRVAAARWSRTSPYM